MKKALTPCRSIEVVMPKEQKGFRQVVEEGWSSLSDSRSRLLVELGKVDKELERLGFLLERMGRRA